MAGFVGNADLDIRIEVVGLKEFIRQVKKADVDPKTMTAIHKKVSEFLVDRVKGSAPPEFQRALRPGATQKAAQVRIGLAPRRAIVEFMGAKRRTGWYAADRYEGSAGRQFRPWVGNQWEPGERRGAPYYIGVPMNAAMPKVEDMFLDEIAALIEETGSGGAARRTGISTAI